MTQVETKVIAAWREAARDLGIHFTAPFSVERSGRHYDALGLVHHYGRRIGTIISVIGEPSSLTKHSADDDYYSSQLSPNYGEYQRQSFIDTLDDWKFYGPAAERPSWYSGKDWS